MAFQKLFVFFLVSLSLMGLIQANTITPAGVDRLHPSQTFRVISLHSSMDVDTRETPEFHDHEDFGNLMARYKDSQPHQFMVHLRNTVTPEVRELLQKDLNVRFGAYLPSNTYMVTVDTDTALRIQQADEVAWIGAYLPEHKMVATLGSASTFEAAVDRGNVYADRLHVLLTTPSPTYDDKRAKDKVVADNAATARKLADMWQDKIGAQLGLSVSCEAHKSGEDVIVYVLPINNGENAEQASAQRKATLQVAQWLTHETSVTMIEPVHIYESHNSNVRGVVQTGEVGNEPFADNLLTGRDQIIGMGDSGIDWDNCFFNDVNTPVPFVPVPDGEPEPNPNRRFVSYDTSLGNDRDDTGHGTQVAGAVAGVAQTSNTNQQNNAEPYDTMAPDALLAFVDMNDGSNLTISIPTRPDLDLFPLTYDRGARIHTYSWGQTQNLYSTEAATTDSFSFANPDFLAIFSAGNQGLDGFGSVNSPATAKNVIAVGASQSVQASFLERRTEGEFEQLAAEWHEAACGPGVFLYQRTQFCAAAGRSTPCEEYKSVLCGMFDGTPEDCCLFPFFSVRCCMSRMLQDIEDNPQLYDINGISPISSRGPAADGRFKPDILAPGDRVITAQSDGDTTSEQCRRWVADDPNNNTRSATVQTIGTSVAAGHVAAAAALVREYLQRGFYPTGQATPETAIPNPSGALIKALLINSAQHMQYLNTNGDAHYITVPAAPNNYEGFGRVQLDRSLFFRNPQSDFNLVFYTDESITVNTSSRRCVVVEDPNARYIKLTLVWTDPSAAAQSGRALVNNLDMLLVNEAGESIRPNNLVEHDALNNVEQIYVENPPVGRYNLIIQATHIGVGTNQLYSLVMTGDFVEEGFCHAVCPTDCSLRGDCTGGLCTCVGGYTGIDCSLTPCPFDCSNHGVCNGEDGTCICSRFWQGTNCDVFNESGEPTPPIINTTEDGSGVDVGVVVAIAICCFILGLVIGLIAGAFFGIRYLIRRQKKRIAYLRSQTAGNKEAHQPLNDDV